MAGSIDRNNHRSACRSTVIVEGLSSAARSVKYEAKESPSYILFSASIRLTLANLSFSESPMVVIHTAVVRSSVHPDDS